MWIRDVDVPPELIDAARAGQLVVFVGAGASRDAPAGLPDFKSLITEIGDSVGRQPTSDDLLRPDVYLGRLVDDHGIDVHRLVANALRRPGSEPNALHRAIVRLAHVHPSPRIVTTNYDLHLTSAAADEGLHVPVYESPALPVGDDFEGIVHLHGSLRQEPRRLVTTDKDFGRAYLLEAWAARFLERMFSAFTVLFIGYSHGDIVMQYLARSLGPSGRRFVCTDNGTDPAWRQYGLAPVSYTVVDGSHAALPSFVARWAELSAMGQTQHRDRIIDIVAAGPPTIPEEISYLDETLEHPERVRYFVEKARGRDWFAWVSARPAFQTLFDRDRASGEPARQLTAWIADIYMLEESTSPLALRALREKKWPPEMWQTLVHRLFAYDGEMRPWLSPWLLLALQTAPGSRSDVLDMLLADSQWAGNIDLALALLEDRTRPVLKSAINFMDAEAARFEVDLPSSEHWLSEAWAKVFTPALGTHLGPILEAVNAQLRRVYRAMSSLGSGFDLVSFGRSAIERHEQDSFREPIDVLIDAARDCIEHALTNDTRLAVRYLDDWATRTDALFRRLAIHGWRLRRDRSADEKLQWLQAQDWLWELPLQHEVYLLLQEMLPKASEDVLLAYVDAAKAGPPTQGDDEVSLYRSYNLLAWLARSVPNQEVAVQAFEKSQAAYPEFATRENPDLNTYTTSGFVENALPFSASELHERIAEDSGAAVAALLELKKDSHPFTGPTWTGALRSVQACVSSHPADGLILGSVLPDGEDALRAAVIDGWETAELDQQTVSDVLTMIDDWDRDKVRSSAAKMLSNGGTQTNPTPWHQFARARETARNLWPTETVKGAISAGDDLVMEAINHPAGDLAEFWTKAVQWDWAQAEDTWNGLPGELTADLDKMITSEDRNGLLASTFLGSQLHFYFAADPTWATTRLLPLFNWNGNREIARGAWQGFLTWGRPNDGLLSAGLLDAYLETCNHEDTLGQQLKHELSTHLALIALRGSIDPLTWLPRFVIGAPEETRVSWTRQVGHFLEDLGTEEANAQWERWIKTYWSGRVESTPLPLTRAEASAMARWLIGLPTARGEAVALLIQTPAGLPENSGFLHRVHGLDLTSDATNWTTALAHLLKGTTGPSWDVRYYLKDIVAQLRAADSAPDLSQLIDEALRLGATEAADW